MLAKRVVVGFSMIVFLASIACVLYAGRSDIADAVMKGDRAAVQKLIGQGSDVNATQPDGATAVHWAAYRGDLQTADLLIRAGANVKAVNLAGATPLSLAALNGNAAMIERLVKAGANPNERGPNGETALMMAARNGSPAAIKVLVGLGADVNAKEPNRETTALMWAVEQEHPAAVKVLIDSGADISAKSKAESGGGRGRGGIGLAGAAQRGAAGQRGAAAGRGGGRGRGAQATTDGAAAAAPANDDQQDDNADQDDQQAGLGGGLTPLVFAARQGNAEIARILLTAGANVNQTSSGGWSPLLTATWNGYYKLGKFLVDSKADPNVANAQGWTPLYLATFKRNPDGGDYPLRPADSDHLEYIKFLLDRGANPNARASANIPRRTVFTGQWWQENGATPFLRAAYSGDVELMKLLLSHGADPLIPTRNNLTALALASGIGWVEGLTHEWSREQTFEAVKMLINLGVDVKAVDRDGRTALHGAAHKGRNEIVQILADHGAKLDAGDNGSIDGRRQGNLNGIRWLPLDYAEGLARVGVQSAIPHPETAALLRKLMAEQGLKVPPPNRNSTNSICLVQVCQPSN